MPVGQEKVDRVNLVLMAGTSLRFFGLDTWELLLFNDCRKGASFGGCSTQCERVTDFSDRETYDVQVTTHEMKLGMSSVASCGSFCRISPLPPSLHPSRFHTMTTQLRLHREIKGAYRQKWVLGPHHHLHHLRCWQSWQSCRDFSLEKLWRQRLLNPSPFSIREQPQMRTRTAPTISISFTHESTSEPHGCRPIQSPLLFSFLFSCSSRGLTYNEFLTLPLRTAHAQLPTIVSIELEIITMQQKPAMQSLHNDENVNIVTDN